ncbi:GIY-YIG nuclease family protein [Marinoscillum sp.]|uniref:GIY-YIG nuclease family protein n=1 Tax=Marinoscillum sp. TaxID=2024838 RepID=UPI003BAA1E93
MASKGGYIYVVSNKSRTVLYTGMTNNLHKRIWEHRNGFGSAFTVRYSCHFLVYYEFYPTIEDAIHREKRIKKYTRAKKDEMIKSFNPDLLDLFEQIEDMQ